jgi:NAD(P)-dependent dehydrogenase (short-subunit alcohol dehydrogenase family)
MDRFLTGKGAVVTGGTRGIGYAIAESLLEHGAAVEICGRTDKTTQEAVASLSKGGRRVTGVAADVADRAQVVRLFEHAEAELGGVDIVINNAGVGVFAPMADMTVADWHKVIDTNLTGVFHCCQQAVPRLRKRGGGYIIQISSLAGKNPFAGGSAYNASKFGLNGFTEAMMLDHRYDKIRFTSICPGTVDTDFSPRSGRTSWKVQPEDIAEIVIGLLRMPERTMVSYLEVRPSLPPRK